MSSQYKVQVCTISDEPDPNFFSIFDPTYRPEILYLVVTEKMTKKAEWFTNAVSTLVKEVRTRKIENENDPSSVQLVYDRILKEVATNPETKGKVLVNITGGLKPQAIAAVRSCEKYGEDYVYFSLDINKFICFEPLVLETNTKEKKSPYHDVPLNLLQGKMVEKYLIAHGVEITGEGDFLDFWSKPNSAQKGFIDYVLENGSNGCFRKALQRLKNLKSGVRIPGGYVKRLEKPENISEEELVFFKQILEKVHQLGLVKLLSTATPNDKLSSSTQLPCVSELLKEGAIDFKSEDNFFFLAGGRWLEQYTAGKIMELGWGIRPFNLKFHQYSDQVNGKGQSVNEIDVVFFYRKKLHIIEVKSGLAGTQGPDSQNLIHKVKVVADDTGGKASKAAIVSWYRPDFVERAKKERIRVIYDKSVSDQEIFKEDLKKWILSQ